MGFIIPVSLILFLGGLVWGLWLIFRKGDLVTQPAKMIGYFLGAFIAFAVALLFAVWIMPAWADQMLELATRSTSVQSLQQKTQQILDQSFGRPTSTPIARPNPTASPLARPASSMQFSGTIHTVQRGENLYRIAQKYGISQQDLQAFNNITDPNKIYAGQRLNIPRP
jgi:LysM repeat protein